MIVVSIPRMWPAEQPPGGAISWSFVGAEGVGEEVPDATVEKILSTVRLHTSP
ncbi:hypothetical protein [Streptomyces sp. 2A115]|uniref:hypothetical protein n=1 Tax=Streptomyces sp. 2A115 TaxID=3457439 RepID=UPI003FD4B5F7